MLNSVRQGIEGDGLPRVDSAKRAIELMDKAVQHPRVYPGAGAGGTRCQPAGQVCT